MSRFARGSEWRVWDLQIHTPHSILNNQFGDDFDEYAKRMLKSAVENNVSAVGITDYFSIKGYKQLRSILDNPTKLESLVGSEIAEKISDILFLPNIELRCSPVIQVAAGRDGRVNCHVIFSDDLDPELIEEHFFRQLMFTESSNPEDPDNRASLIESNLMSLGRRLREEHRGFQGRNDLYVGMMNAVILPEDLTKVLQHKVFRDKYLIVLEPDEDLSKIKWNSQGHHSRKLWIQKSHLFFSSSPGTRAFGLGELHDSPDDFRKEFGELKPCIHSSDAHTYDALFSPDQGRYTWIKADLTFRGLKQVLNEPRHRIFIGERPPQINRVEQRPTKHMTSVSFDRTDMTKTGDDWFSGSIPLNPGLVAIIGNKGSGKSALADILGLLGNSNAYSDFSFLNSSRFLNKRTQYGSRYKASVSWASGKEINKRLDAGYDAADPELVKYIPQTFLEKICNDLADASNSRFDEELRAVIFSHLTRADRLNHHSLEELLSFKSAQIQDRIGQLSDRLHKVNVQISELEYQSTESNRKKLEARFRQKQTELEAHLGNKPTDMDPPTANPETVAETQRLVKRLEETEAKLERVRGELEVASSEEMQLAMRVATAERLLGNLANLDQSFKSFVEEVKVDVQNLGLQIGDIVTLKIEQSPLLAIKSEAQRNREATRIRMEGPGEQALKSRALKLEQELVEIRAQLDEPNRAYQNHLVKVKEWEQKRVEIVGNIDEPETLRGLQQQIKALGEIPGRLAELERERWVIVELIFREKEQLLSSYASYYAPVQEVINQEAVGRDALQIRASIILEGFAESFFNLIHRGKTGSFYGEREGWARLQDIVESADTETWNGVQNFLKVIVDSLRNDRRNSDARPVLPHDQLRQGVDLHNLYDFLFRLDYLTPRFELRWQDRRVEQLSPGERGMLLLIFYLLVDHDDIPLIIDQPEENLDNQTIAQMLVPAIQVAKNRRQIIIVTHNPNLAVVCDADQIIHAKIDKQDGNRITYTSGSLENPDIARLIVDVLEGTMPAFDLRDAKYETALGIVE